MSTALDIMARVWADQDGWVFLPWINGSCATAEDRRKSYHEGPAFKWPEDRARIAQHITDHTDDDLYWTPGVFNAKARREENLNTEHVLWADLDEANPRKLDRQLRPTIAWETSPGRYQGVWIMDSPREGASWAGNENHRLTYTVGADPSGWDSTQLLRVPEHVNHKPGYGRPEGRVLWNRSARTTWATITPLLQQVTAASVTAPNDDPRGDDQVDVQATLKRLKLPSAVRQVIRSRTAEGDRSDQVWFMCRSLAEHGATRDEIAAIVKSTVWNKYSDDALYRQVDKALATHAMATFWDSRPSLRYIRDFAYSRMAVPWAVLGGVLQSQLAAVPPQITLPPLIGGRGSLNLFIALAGPSGAGKDTAISTAADLPILPSPYTVEVGSGEGIVHQYRRKPKDNEEPEPDGFVEARTQVLFVSPEVDLLKPLMSRDSSTLSSVLRKAFTGSALGFAYADSAKRPQVAAHTYRMGWVVGVQPERSGPLLDNSDGGLPQRFLWLPATDPTISADAPEPGSPPPMGVRDFPMVTFSVDVPPAVVRIVREAHAARARGEGDVLDGHALFVREKVAYALALLDRRHDGFTMEDWELAGQVMAVSDETRRMCHTALREANSAANRARGRADAEREDGKEMTVKDRCREAVLKLLAKPDNPVLGVRRSTFPRAIGGPRREFIDEVLSDLVEEGRVTLEVKANPKGEPTRWYRLNV